VDPLNSAFTSVDGVLFDKSRTTLLQCPPGKVGSYTIPDGVISIGELFGSSPFSGCISLTSVTFPSSVTCICSDAAAFSYCTSLTAAYFHGNQPDMGHAFSRDSNVTLYYLPGTTGWSPIVAGRPTALWLPQAQTSDASFGLRTNQFGFNITWASGMTVVVEATPTLANPTWSPLATNTLAAGSSYFSDPQWTNHPTSFYRLRMP
jgi:hypothetical protein